MPIIEIYTDGGCIGNPGPGGWAFVALEGEEAIERNGAVEQTTNNRMELMAVIQALEFVQGYTTAAKPEIRIVTDSEYVRKGISEWINNWIRNGWKTSGRKPVKNQDLWVQLHELQSSFRISWDWVKGHSGDRYNERCDSLVQEAIRKLTPDSPR
jgi:ribonuclease HI